MREIAFIQQNKEKWLIFDAATRGEMSRDPRELADLYISLMNDLAFAQTYYPRSKVVSDLNQLCAKAYQGIYKTRRADYFWLPRFFTTTVPLIMYKYRYIFWIALSLFLISVGIGVLSARYNEAFIRQILGDSYVEMTLENIRDGNPVAVYKSGSNWGSFIAITYNNIQVAVRAFVLGITGGIGTAYIALTNGIMLGAFQYLFLEQGVFWQSVRGVWIHGAMEIFSIVIATMAGLILANGIWFPGTFTRKQSLINAFKEGFIIFLSTLPFFFVAGFFEGFVTRYALDIPVVPGAVIIIGSLGFIIWYYMIFPIRVVKKIIG